MKELIDKVLKDNCGIEFRGVAFGVEMTISNWKSGKRITGIITHEGWKNERFLKHEIKYQLTELLNQPK